MRGREKTQVKVKWGIKDLSANPSSIKVTERNKGSVKSKKKIEVTVRKFNPGKSSIVQKKLIYSIPVSRHAMQYKLMQKMWL